MRWSASAAHSTTAISATMTVNGRERAAKTRRMWHLLRSLTGLRDHGLYIPASGSQLQHGPPDVQVGQGIVDLRLDQQSLSLLDIVDRSEPRLVPRGGLLDSGAGRGYFDWGVSGDT